MRRFALPAMKALQPWISAGLVVEAEKPGFVVPLDWCTIELNTFLRHLFPNLFEYFDSIDPIFQRLPDQPDAIGVKCIDYTLPYVLLQKTRMTYTVVDATHPDAMTCKDHLSGEKAQNAGFRAKSLFLGRFFPATSLYLITVLIRLNVA